MTNRVERLLTNHLQREVILNRVDVVHLSVGRQPSLMYLMKLAQEVAPKFDDELVNENVGNEDSDIGDLSEDTDVGIPNDEDSDGQLKSDIFGTSYANPAGVDVQAAIQDSIIELKTTVSKLAKSLYGFDLADVDAMKIVKESLKNMSSKIADIPIDDYISNIDSFIEGGTKTKSPVGETKQPTPPSPVSPQGNTQQSPAEEPLEPVVPNAQQQTQPQQQSSNPYNF